MVYIIESSSAKSNFVTQAIDQTHSRLKNNKHGTRHNKRNKKTGAPATKKKRGKRAISSIFEGKFLKITVSG